MKRTRVTQSESVNGQSKSNGYINAPTGNMEAIAYGVQARLDERTSFSRRVTDETVNTARALGVSESVIERWEAQRLNRLAREIERLREIRALLEKSSREKPFMAVRTRV
jgi:hypothetical protein